MSFCFKWVVNYNLVCFSVSSLSARVHLNSIFHFTVMAATSVYVNYPNTKNKVERKFWLLIVLAQFVCWIVNIMWCDVLKLPWSYTATCILGLILNFQWTMRNIAIYRNMHFITMYCDVYRVLKFLQIPSLITCQWSQKCVTQVLIKHFNLEYYLMKFVACTCYLHITLQRSSFFFLFF